MDVRTFEAAIDARPQRWHDGAVENRRIGHRVGRRRRFREFGALLAVLAFLVSACGAPPPVEVEESNRLVPDTDSSGPAGPGDVTGNVPPAERPASALTWGSCDTFAIPPAADLGTTRWECAVLEAPMDPFDEGSAEGVGSVELAVTRHPATGTRRGAILMNPGGPGASGLESAWFGRSGFPVALLRSFDIVSWDPRGVGRSTPGIQCDDSLSPGEVAFIAACVEATGPLSGFLSAPYSAADMEAIRRALGEDTLDYLGFSYGSILGATYAAAYPDAVGAFVLDGVTDPLAGSIDGPMNGTFAAFADDGFQRAHDRFLELCDASSRCLGNSSTTGILDGLGARVPGLDTDDYDGEPERIEADAFDQFVDSIVIYAGDWELVATALFDADSGDASAMAAYIGGGPFGQAGESDVRGDGNPTTFDEANLMIYCADVGELLVDATFCDAMTPSAHPLRPVQNVDLARDALVIGTEYDPLTPGYHAPEFRAAFGAATHMIWEGVGHTAFPGWTTCIDDAVEAQFLRVAVPADGTRCAFLDGVDTDEEIADVLFGSGDLESSRVLDNAISRRFPGVDAQCAAIGVNQQPDQVISHVVLGVTSDQASAALEAAVVECE